jgi:hypothetical protein
MGEEKHDRLKLVRDMKTSELNFVQTLSSQLSDFSPDVRFRFSLSPEEIFKFSKFYFEKMKSWIQVLVLKNFHFCVFDIS